MSQVYLTIKTTNVCKGKNSRKKYADETLSKKEKSNG
jgi:hypothetical protein